MCLFNMRHVLPVITIGKNRMTRIKELIPGESPLVIDGGAHKGEFTKLILRQYSDPEIYGYEPIPALADALKDKYKHSEKITIRQAALGSEENSTQLHITQILPASSILESGLYAKKYHDNGLDVKETIDISQVRLDAEISQSIDILKLDLQGYELEALKGAEKVLDKIKLILVEVEFVPLYKNQPLFAEIDVYLRANGFRLLNLYDLYTHLDGQLTSGDAIYLNSKYFS